MTEHDGRAETENEQTHRVSGDEVRVEKARGQNTEEEPNDEDKARDCERHHEEAECQVQDGGEDFHDGPPQIHDVRVRAPERPPVVKRRAQPHDDTCDVPRPHKTQRTIDDDEDGADMEQGKVDTPQAAQNSGTARTPAEQRRPDVEERRPDWPLRSGAFMTRVSGDANAPSECDVAKAFVGDAIFASAIPTRSASSWVA